jgi:hypothetical protein
MVRLDRAAAPQPQPQRLEAAGPLAGEPLLSGLQLDLGEIWQAA